MSMRGICVTYPKVYAARNFSSVSTPKKDRGRKLSKFCSDRTRRKLIYLVSFLHKHQFLNALGMENNIKVRN